VTDDTELLVFILRRYLLKPMYEIVIFGFWNHSSNFIPDCRKFSVLVGTVSRI
jgi:hypothetical protein